MTSDFDIIKQHLTYGHIKDCMMKQDAKCLGGVNSMVWMIKGYEGLFAYHRISENIHNDKKIFPNYTIQQVNKKIDEVIINNAKNKSLPQSQFIKLAKQSLPINNAQNYDVLRNIWGIYLSKGYRKLGPFTFQKSNNALKTLTKGYDRNIVPDKSKVSDFTVRCTVVSSTNERALEIADECFKNLEYLFAFILGRKNSGHEVRILDQTREITLFHVAKGNDGQMSFGGSRKNLAHNQIDLNDKFFLNKTIKRLFSFPQLSNQNAPNIDRRIQRAIKWIGKGLLANTPIESIINYTTALESLLIRQSNTIISPSIVASLSEYCAFLLSKSPELRVEIANKVKQIYSARSAGTHGGKSKVNAKEEYQALDLSRSLVYKFLELYPSKISTENEMANYIELKKYK